MLEYRYLAIASDRTTQGVVMAKGQGHGFFCFCKKCTGQSKSKPKPVQLGGSSSFPTRDTGGKPAKRQTQKNHGTNRQGGYKKR